MKERKAYYCFIILFYLFVFQIYLEKYLNIFGFLDEIFALVAFPFFIYEIKNNHMKINIKRNGFLGLMIVFVIVGLLGNFCFSYQPIISVALPGAYVNIKFWLCLYLGRMLFQNLNLGKYAFKIYKHVFRIVLLFTVLIIIDNIFHIYKSEIRYGLRATQLFYDIPTAFAAYCVFLFVILLAIQPYVKRSSKVCIWVLVLLCSTLRSKAFAATFAFGVIYYFTYIRKKKIRFRTLLMCIPMILFLVWDQIEYYFFSSMQYDSARYQLLMTSIKIATQFFPIGTGFGSFASNLSVVNYSPLYSIYGIQNVHGLREGAAYFASDSFWAMILGETGITGGAVFVIVIIRLFKRIQSIRKVDVACYVSSLSAMTYLLIISMAEAAFVNALTIPLAIWLGIMLNESEKYCETKRTR